MITLCALDGHDDLQTYIVIDLILFIFAISRIIFLILMWSVFKIDIILVVSQLFVYRALNNII